MPPKIFSPSAEISIQDGASDSRTRATPVFSSGAASEARESSRESSRMSGVGSFDGATFLNETGSIREAVDGRATFGR